MAPAIFYTALALLLALLTVFTRLFQARRPRLNLPPSGPLRLPIIGHLHHLRQPLHQALARLSARYGPVLFLRFGYRRVLVVSSPSLAEECFTTNDVVFANRPYLLSGKHFAYENTAFGAAPYGPHWRNIRRITALHIFSSSRLAAGAPVRAAEVRSLLRQLLPRDGPAFLRVEMRPKLMDLTFNVMTQVVAGKRVVGDGAAEEGARFRRIIEEVFELSAASIAADFIPFMGWAVSGSVRRMVRVARAMDEQWQLMIDERRRRRGSEVEEKKTVIDVMLSLQDTDPTYYTDEVIKGTMQILLVAGTETSAVTMEWVMSLLLNNPNALRKAREELDIQVGHERLVTEDDLPNLSYFQNVIKETHRLFPAGPLLVPHQSSSDCTVGGFDVPRGTMLLVNAYVMHRDPNLWADATVFKPERFEGGEEEGFKFIPFGAGRRSCPGEALATRTVGLVLATLIQCFEWERIGEEEVDLSEGHGLSMPKAVPLEVMCKPREAMSSILLQL